MSGQSSSGGSGCYCCSQPVPTSASSMEIDAALNELGMLSTVTDSRKQYLAERNRRRVRQVSEPSETVSMTPANSPDKGAYQIVKLNPQFVTSLSSGLTALQVTRTVAQEAVQLGSRYNQETLDRDAKSNRLSRLKGGHRLRRFRKPYEVPWLQRHSIDVCYNIGGESLSNENSNDSFADDEKPSCSSSNTCSPPLDININPSPLSIFTTPEKTRPADRLCCSSNASTPEKTSHNGQQVSVARSKSLDDLDFSKLRLAEVENHNFIRQKREIDSMSLHMQNLNVNE